jgi:hypothetical protein
MAIFLERPLSGGTQVVHKFDNGFGASVVQHQFSYGGDDGLFELGVIKFREDDKWDLCYETEVTDDVIGYLDEDDVQSLLTRIEELNTQGESN